MEETGSENEPKENGINKKKRTRGPTKQTKYPLPPSHTSFDYHLKLLKGLNIVSKKGSNYVTYKQVAPIAGIAGDTVSKLLKFYFDIGILERDKGGSYKPRHELIEFLNKFEWDDSGLAFGKIIIKTWIGECILQLFEMKKEISSEDLVKNLGRYSEADKTNSAELKIILKILVYGKIIEFDDKSKNYHLSPIHGTDLLSGLEQPFAKKDENNLKESEEGKDTEFTDNTHKNKKLKNDESLVDTLKNRVTQSESQISPPFCGSISIQLMVSLNEDSDIEKIASKILRLKQMINNN